MRRDSRLSGVLHLLLHMARAKRSMTSEELALSMDTNPVVIRRLLAGLRNAGYVASEKGHGGGWTLECDLAKVSLRDVYVALGEPELLAIGNRTDAPGCLVEQAVNARLGMTFDAAEALLLKGFEEVTLAMLNDEIGEGVAAWQGGARARTASGQQAHDASRHHTHDSVHRPRHTTKKRRGS